MDLTATYYEARYGARDQSEPVRVIGRYPSLGAALIAAEEDHGAPTAEVSWFPDEPAEDSVWSMYLGATDHDREPTEVETDWHVVKLSDRASALLAAAEIADGFGGEMWTEVRDWLNGLAATR